MREHLGRYLSYILRHRPDSIGLSVDRAGWASIEDIVTLSSAAHPGLHYDDIIQVLRTDAKSRFTLSADQLRIRAAQGHSIAVDLGLVAVPPPDILYHGTAERFLPGIQEYGILKGKRRYVHLSADPATAEEVSRRHGTPVVLIVDVAGMAASGAQFFRADNGVWLTEHVPADRVMPNQSEIHP